MSSTEIDSKRKKPMSIDIDKVLAPVMDVSIWKLYNFLKVKSMDYLKHHRIEHVDDFMGYMRIRRYDISCHKIVNTGLTFLNAHADSFGHPAVFYSDSLSVVNL